MAADPKKVTPSSSPGVRAAVAAAQRKVASNPGLRARVQKLRKRVAKKRGESAPVFAKLRGAQQQAAPGLRKLKKRGAELDDLLKKLKSK
jgi:hypothetical protein